MTLHDGILRVRGFRFYFTPLAGVLFAFPSRYYSLSVMTDIQPWIVVDPASGGVPRAPPYSGTAPASPVRCAYAALTPSGRTFQSVPLRMGFITCSGLNPRAALQPQFPRELIWAPPRSLAATRGISVDFCSLVT